MFRFNEVPYSKFLELRFTKSNLRLIEFKLSYRDQTFKLVYFGEQCNMQKKQQQTTVPIQTNECEVKNLQSQKQKEKEKLQQSKEQQRKST